MVPCACLPLWSILNWLTLVIHDPRNIDSLSQFPNKWIVVLFSSLWHIQVMPAAEPRIPCDGFPECQFYLGALSAALASRAEKCASRSLSICCISSVLSPSATPVMFVLSPLVIAQSVSPRMANNEESHRGIDLFTNKWMLLVHHTCTNTSILK